jgi:hypothetical protein
MRPRDVMREHAFVVKAVSCIVLAALLLTLVIARFHVRKLSSERHPFERGWVGRQELLSPDRGYYAIVPEVWRDNVNPSNQYSTCGTNRATLSVVPNDREWKPYQCATLRMSLCDLPVAMWRTNDELFVQLADYIGDDLELATIKGLEKKISVVGPGGDVILPKIVNPQVSCSN